MPPEIVTAGQSRVWVVENGVGPNRGPALMACAKIGDSTYNFGDVTRIECPDPNQYGHFIEAAAVQGEVERPTASIMGRYPQELSDLLRLGRKRCRIDVYVLMGQCRDPQNFVQGWEKIRYYPSARITSWADENAGALQSDENAPTNETAELSAKDIDEVKRLAFEEVAVAQVARQVITVDVCDSVNCGDCGEPSDGCEKVFATQVGVGATPGTRPSVVFSDDGGNTWQTTDIDTLFSNEPPSDAACISGDFVVVANTPNSLHYAVIADLLEAIETWVEVITGFVAGGEPNAIWSVDARHTWIVGDGGYIYFTADHRSGVTVQNAGVATIRDLQDIHAVDASNAVAVGDLNSIVRTTDGGETWQTVTGPVPGLTITTVWMHSKNVWTIGCSDGRVFYTTDGGVDWTLKALPITVQRIDEIEFATEAVGYMSARDGAAHSQIMRTIDGGYSWYTMPEGPGGAPIPDNDQINSLAVCPGNPNVVFAGGLGGNASDGIIIKAA